MSNQDLCSDIIRLSMEVLDLQQQDEDPEDVSMTDAVPSQTSRRNHQPKLRQLLRHLDRTLNSLLKESEEMCFDLPLDNLLQLVITLDCRSLASDLESIVARICLNTANLILGQEAILPSSSDATVLVEKIVNRDKHDGLKASWLSIVNHAWDSHGRVPHVVVTSQWSSWLDQLLPMVLQLLDQPRASQANPSTGQTELHCSIKLQLLSLNVMIQALDQQQQDLINSQDFTEIVVGQTSAFQSQSSGSTGKLSSATEHSEYKSGREPGLWFSVKKVAEHTLDSLDVLAIAVQHSHQEPGGMPVEFVHDCAVRAGLTASMLANLGHHIQHLSSAEYQLTKDLDLFLISILETMLATQFLNHRNLDEMWVYALVDVAENTSKLGVPCFTEGIVSSLLERTFPYPLCCQRLLAVIPRAQCKGSTPVRRVLQVGLVIMKREVEHPERAALAERVVCLLRDLHDPDEKPDQFDSLVESLLTEK